MNQDLIEGRFEQMKGKIKEAWGLLSDDDIALANGQREQFIGKLQERYGLARDDAEKRLDSLAKSCDWSAGKDGQGPK